MNQLDYKQKTKESFQNTNYNNDDLEAPQFSKVDKEIKHENDNTINNDIATEKDTYSGTNQKSIEDPWEESKQLVDKDHSKNDSDEQNWADFDKIN